MAISVNSQYYSIKFGLKWQRLLRNTYANAMCILRLFFLLFGGRRQKKTPKRINSAWVVFSEYSFHFVSFGLVWSLLFKFKCNLIFVWFFPSNFSNTEFLQPQHIWPYIQQNFMHHHSQVHYQGFHVSSCFHFSFIFPNLCINLYIENFISFPIQIWIAGIKTGGTDLQLIVYIYVFVYLFLFLPLSQSLYAILCLFIWLVRQNSGHKQ